MNFEADKEQHILRILKESLPPKYVRQGIKKEMTLHGDLGMDSMAMASFAFRVEDELNVSFNELVERVADFRTVADVLTIIGSMAGSDGHRPNTAC